MQITDQLNYTFQLPKPPTRIISLVPSQTELLFELGLEKEVIGITKFCVHPDHWFKNKLRIGGTKNLYIDKIQHAKPDLIIANKEENRKEDIEFLRQYFPVWTSQVSDYSQALEMIQQIGFIANRPNEAFQLIHKIDDARLAYLDLRDQQNLGPLKVVYLIWKDPFMTIGSDTFIHEMLKLAGFTNAFSDQTRYPIVSLAQIKEREADYIFLSSEPYPFREQHLSLFDFSKAVIVDGEAFSWYGSRMLSSFSYFCRLIQMIQ
ncbi:MAG: ABC transporter substrate-binding protein [Saprospiraceae bacterium]|nr:ABC transporter substrate-binding protein [Saprospiraceae bacterium]